MRKAPKGWKLWRRIITTINWHVRNGSVAIFLVLAVVFVSCLEAIYVQTSTTNRIFSSELFQDKSFLLLSAIDFLVPLTVALLNKWGFMIYIGAQCLLSVILLHYRIFFYNTLTLSTIYHSMQGVASLGIDIFGFARWDIIILLGLLLVVKLFIVQIAMVPRPRMPKIFQLRGIIAVALMTLITWLTVTIYGKTGLTNDWVDFRGHRPAVERRFEEGARESVRNIGYVATWLGEFLSGNYRDTALIYAEIKCLDPDGGLCLTSEPNGESRQWQNLPVPNLANNITILQVESLDFAILNMTIKGRPITPFLNKLARNSLVLKVFAPHKVGSSNSDYEILNSRLAEQNVIYYTYIKNYPDSIIHLLKAKGLSPAFFHGLPGVLFNLREAYSAQGFEDLHFKEELLKEGYPNSDLIMEHIQDEYVFDSAAKHLNPGGNAQFIVTMSSHVPFMEAAPEFTGVGENFARYVTSLNYVDRCLEKYFEKMEDGSLLIIWGDHGSDVRYPRIFPPGVRVVPFIVQVKGQDKWLKDWASARSEEESAVVESEASGIIYTDGRTHSLCALSYYLRCLLY